MSRLSEFRRRLAQREIPAAIVTEEIAIAYLCGYRYTDGYLFITPARAYAVTDFRYFEEAESRVFPGFEVVMPENRTAFLTDVLKAEGAVSLGFDSRHMTVAELHYFERALPSVSFVPMGDILSEMRKVKGKEEIAAIQQAQKITDLAFTHILSWLTPEKTETEVALELEFYIRKQGAAGVSFEIIAVSGAASALPHGKCRPQKLEKGFLTMDFGCTCDGYCSDMTRTVCIGKATPEMKRLYETVKNAQEKAILAISAGKKCADMDAVARNLIEGAGYHGAFGHSLGHGVGLEIHEAPNLSLRAGETLLQAGNIVTVEPGIYLPGKYGCRIEDMGAVTETGFEDFTASPKDLIEIF